MDPSEGGDLERVFNICDTDADGLLSKEELESILKDIGVENADINEFMWGLQNEEFITYPQFVYAIEKFRSQSNNSGSALSLHGSRVSPRSQAGSAAGGQVYSLEAQIHELVQHTEDQEKNEKLQSKELRKLQARFSSLSAELEVLKQINKDVSGRESDLKRQLKHLQDQKSNIEYDLQTARAQLDAARSGENALRNAMELDAGIAHETQAELARLADALERSEVEVQQLIKTNEDLVKLRQDDEYQIKVLDARIERLNLEVEAKDTLFAEIGFVQAAGQVHDKLGNTWHGFRTVSPLFSELGQVQNEPTHPSLVDDRNLQIMGKNSLDSAFLKEKVANLNEEIRRRAPAVHRHTSGPVSPQSDEAGDSDVAFSSLSESDKPEQDAEKASDDQNDLVTNQLMNLSDLVITTSDITHSECNTPTYHRDGTSTPSAEKGSSSTSPVPASDATVGTEDGDADKEDGEDEESESERERESEKEKDSEREETKPEVEALPSPQYHVERASTPTPSHTFGVSPDEAHQHAKDIEHKKGNENEKTPSQQPNGKTPRRGSEDHITSEAQLQNGFTTPRSAPSTDRSSNYATPYSYRSTPRNTPRRPEELATSRSAPTTFRSEDSNTNADTTPLKSIKHSKSEVIRSKADATPSKLETVTPSKMTPNRRELVRHKSEVSLYNSDLGFISSPSAKMLEKVTPDQANELHEFALRAGLLRPRPDFMKLDKYAQVTPADLDEAQVPRSRSQRNITSTPHSANSTNTQSTPKTTTSRSVRTPASAHVESHHVDRKIVVRGHTYLVRLLSHPDPALDDLEDTVKKLEAELVAIEERFNKSSSSSSSSSALSSSTSASSSSPSTNSTTTPSSSSIPATPTAAKARTPRTPVAPATSPSSSLSSSHHSFTNRRTLRPSPLVTSTSFKKESKFKNWKFWLLALVGVVLSMLFLAFIVSSKLQVTPTTPL